jgi:hypothetical protein
MKTYITGIIVAVIAITAVGGVYLYKTNQKDTGGIACTMEAKICPDGSAVGRTGPNCEFAECPQGVTYKNEEYGLAVSLPGSWEGYSVSVDKWTGNAFGDQLGDVAVAEGPVVSIHNPKWTGVGTYQDIPIMIFTIGEWGDLQADKFHIGAAPVNPSELSRNSKYVFALPARYNFTYPEGFEEVEQILAGKPVSAFEPGLWNVSPITLMARLGQKVSGLDVALTPLEVTGDSRCPTDVQCIWAGTVNVRTMIESGMGESTMVFELGKPITTEAEEITLTEVRPAPKTGVKIQDGDYRFQFEVKKREGDKSDKIRLISPLPGGVIKSPLIVKGEARGNWYFEASFPVILTNWDGLIIAEGIATAESDWMTTEFVPFTATLEFEIPKYKNNGFLILKKDNPSGLPEHDDALEIQVLFGQ